MGSRRFVVIDTGGISGDEDGIDSQMAGQSSPPSRKRTRC